MNTSFDFWFGQVRDICRERGHPLPTELTKDQMYKWKVHFDNKLEPSEAIYNVIDLAQTQLGMMPNISDDL